VAFVSELPGILNTAFVDVETDDALGSGRKNLV